MDMVHTLAGAGEVLGRWRADHRRIGFVPTMGALHRGHRSLIERAVTESDAVVVSVFVNPLQFGPSEDLGRYPRSLEADCAMAEEVGAAMVLAPPVDEMYPAPMCTTVRVAGVSESLEGAHRPGHFDGVATVVQKLFNVVGPCHSFFGEKDWQQLAVIRRMVLDLSIPVVVVACPTVREPDGLAMSSRNLYLSPAERKDAGRLFAALRRGAELIEAGERDLAVVEGAMADVVSPVADLEYAVVVEASTLVPVRPLRGELRLLVAARFSTTRLIDNLGVSV